MKKIYKYTIILSFILCIGIPLPCAIALASSEGMCIKKDVVVYNITLKEPDPEAVKEGLALKEPDGTILAVSPDSPGKPGLPGAAKAYANYYKRIRNKIRDRLVSCYYTGLTEGEISLVFILTSAGKLESVNIDEAVSAKDHTLRDITISSVKESAPFPPFPKTLDASKMSFDLSVSFRKK